MTMTDKQPATVDLDNPLDCIIEHLDGEHEGKIVIDRDKFEKIYALAERGLLRTDL